MAAAGEPRDIYFEFTAIGGSVKVVAIDGATGTEVRSSARSSAAQADLQAAWRWRSSSAELARESGKPHI